MCQNSWYYKRLIFSDPVLGIPDKPSAKNEVLISLLREPGWGQILGSVHSFNLQLTPPDILQQWGHISDFASKSL